MKVYLAASIQAEIFEQMNGTYPNEGGGFLLGTQENDAIRIAGIIQVENTFAAEEQFHRYAMTPLDWARLEDEADERGLTLVGYYHSHPDSPAVPSIYDRDHALPNFTYIITSVHSGPKSVEQRVWQLRADRSQFDEGELIIT